MKEALENFMVVLSNKPFGLTAWSMPNLKALAERKMWGDDRPVAENDAGPYGGLSACVGLRGPPLLAG